MKQEFTRQREVENRIYYEPRCIEGNFGLPGLLRGRRARSKPSRKDAVPIREPRTMSAGFRRFGTICQ